MKFTRMSEFFRNHEMQKQGTPEAELDHCGWTDSGTTLNQCTHRKRLGKQLTATYDRNAWLEALCLALAIQPALVFRQ